MSFRPYSGDNSVVADSSRFEFDDHLAPRNRSRDASPLTIDDANSSTTFSTIIPPYSTRINKPKLLNQPSSPIFNDNLSYSDNRHPSIKLPSNHDAQLRFSSLIYPEEIIYDKQRQQQLKNNPLPPTPPSKEYDGNYFSNPMNNFYQIQQPLQSPPLQSHPYQQPQIHEQTPYNTSHKYDIHLPPQMDPATYVGQVSKSKQKQLEHDLVKQVMNPSTWKITRKQEIDQDNWVDIEYSVSLFAVLHVFEVICGIITISLSSILLDRDESINPGYYRYLLSDLVITLAISFLLLTKAVNYESRNGVFYSTLATIMKIVSFIIVTAIIIPNNDCHIPQACPMRKALSSFIIICTFLWLVNCVIFLTTLYISHLDLLRNIPNSINNDEKVDSLPPQPTPGGGTPSIDYIDEKSGPLLKEYFLNDQGEMHELTKEINIANKRKVIVYI